MSEEGSEVLKVEGRVIAGPKKVKIRHSGTGVEEVTLSGGILRALRVKAKKHRFLSIEVVMDNHGRRIIVAETSEK